MKFFVPGFSDRGEALQFYRELAKGCAERYGKPLTPAALFAIRYRFEGREYLAQVGVPHPPGPDAAVVLAIFPTSCDYLVCTRGATEASFRSTVIPRDSISDAEFFNGIDDAILLPECDSP